MAAGDSITSGFNPSAFSLGCGFTKTDDSVSTTPDQTCTAGTLTIDGKYNIYFRRRLRETKAYENVGGNAGVGGYRLYTAANKAAYLTGAGASTAEIDLIEFVMCTNTIEVIAESALTGVIDKESVPIVADGANGTQGPEGPSGRDVGENLIDGTGEVKVIDSFDGSGADGVSRWYNNMFTLNDVNLSPNLHYSCQMRVKLEGCGNLNGRNFRIHLTTKGSHYPFICEFTPTKNGTYIIKKEDFTISYASEGFLSGVTFGWDLSIGGDISLGTITIDKVKLEVGEKCTSWCLSENDKKGANVPYYHETYYGWSASASTAVANTDPGDVTWAIIVPSKQADKPYLWMRDRVMTWSSSARRYVEGSYTYTRITGENGTGVRINGSFTKSDWYGYGSIELYLRATYLNPTTGDCYIYQEDGHLWVWNGMTWQDVGRIKGTDGTSQYIHWAWCNTLGPTDQGDEGYPDWTGLNTGFTTFKDAEAKYKYIGVLANDTESPDPDEHYAGYYEWNEVEGPQGPAGKNSVRIDLSNQTDAIAADSNGKARFARTITTTAKVYDGATPVKSGVTVTAATITVVRNGVSTSLTSNPTYGSGGATFSWTIQEGDVLSSVSYPVSISLSYGSPSVTYTAEFTLTRIDAQAVFQLLPSRDSIDFVRQANNTLSPTNIQIWCGYKKYTGSGTETYASNYNGEGVTNFESSGYSIYVRHLKADGTPNIWDATGNTSPYGWIVMAYTGDYVRDIYNNTAFSAVQFCIAPAKDRTLWTDADIIDLETIPIVKDGTNGADGTSPWFADLDNEMDSVACNANGVVETQQSVSTNLSLFYGSTPQSFKIAGLKRNTTVVTKSSTISRMMFFIDNNTFDSLPSAADTSHRLTIQYSPASSISDKDDFAITLQPEDATSETRVLHFTINGVKPGEDGQPATIFRLQPSASSVKRDKSNNLSPSSLTCDVLKVVGNDTPTRATSYDGTLYYLKNGDITSSSTSGISTLTINTGSISLTATDTYVTFAFFVGTKMVDKERVPVVYDGDDGNDSVVYTIECTDTVKPGDDYHDVMICRAEGSNIQRKTLYDAKDDWGVYLTASPNGVTIDDDDPDSQFGVERITITSDTVITLSLHAYNGTVIATKEIRGVVDGNNGDDGAPGHIGRWYEFAGEYGSGLASSLSNTDDHGWFAKRGDNFFMLIADSGVSVQTSTMPMSATSSPNWEYMGGDRQYYIAKAFFGDYANLGAFVINGDWMISTNGTINGTAYNSSDWRSPAQYNGKAAYKWFDPANPNNNTRTNFIPVYAVDGLTGKVYMNDAHINGDLTAGNIEITKTQGNGYVWSGLASTSSAGDFVTIGVRDYGNDEYMARLNLNCNGQTGGWIEAMTGGALTRATVNVGVSAQKTDRVVIDSGVNNDPDSSESSQASITVKSSSSSGSNTKITPQSVATKNISASGNINLAGQLLATKIQKTTNSSYNASTSDFIIIFNGGSSQTLYLPTTGLSNGQVIIAIKLYDGDVYIYNGSTYLKKAQKDGGSVAICVCDGTTWY